MYKYLVLTLSVLLASRSSFFTTTPHPPALAGSGNAAPNACPPGAPWEVKAPRPGTGLIQIGLATDGQYAYTAGGYTLTGYSNQFTRYDPAANTWETPASLPDPAAAVLLLYGEGQIFALGGNGPGNTFLATNRIVQLDTFTWMLGAPLPAVRAGSAGGYSNGKLYVAGGTNGLDLQSTLFEYNIAANTWITRAPMPTALTDAAYAVIDNRLYVAGGYPVTNSLYAYDPATDSWTTLAPMPTARYAAAGAVYAGKLWVFGGATSAHAHGTGATPEALAVTEIYDPATNTWATGPGLGIARRLHGGTTVRNQVIAFGGLGNSTSGSLSSTEVATQPGLRVLIAQADGPLGGTHLRPALLDQPGVARVDIFDVQTGTLTLTQLLDYDLVYAYSNYYYYDPVTLGNALADFHDAGGVVVPGFASFHSQGNHYLQGRWLSAGYSPYGLSTIIRYDTVPLGAHQRGHPLLARVSWLEGRARLFVPLGAGGVSVAHYVDGTPAMGYKVSGGRAIVGLPAYSDYPLDYIRVSYAAILVNAGYWSKARCAPAFDTYRATLPAFFFNAGAP